MASAGFGEHLRREREMRGVSLEEIAGATRISTRFLDALEKEAWDRLPGGVFNRGFVRTVARFLGLEEESLLAEYSLAKGERGAPSVRLEAPAQPPFKSHRVPWLAVAAIPVLLALGAGGWWAWRWASARQAELNAAAVSLPAAPVPPSAPSSLWTPEDPPEVAAATGENLQRLSASPWSIPSSDLHLKIDATRDAALVVTSDGQLVFAGTVAAGQSRSISAKTALTVEAQDAGAIRLELNGQTLAPIGPPGQPGRITLGHPSVPVPTQ
jgi:cytoskeleton protein RodZ